jgi:hypothetical protein
MGDSRPEQRRRVRPVHYYSLRPRSNPTPNCTYRARRALSLVFGLAASSHAWQAPLSTEPKRGGGAGTRQEMGRFGAGRLLPQRAPPERAECCPRDAGSPAGAGCRLHHLVRGLTAGVRADGGDHTPDRGRPALEAGCLRQQAGYAGFQHAQAPPSLVSTALLGGRVSLWEGLWRFALLRWFVPRVYSLHG